jgi:ABC-type sugar transport system substrate-binding protein
MKRLIVLAMALAMLLPLAACSAGNRAGADTGNNAGSGGELPGVAAPAEASVAIEQVMPSRPLRFAFLCFQNDTFGMLVRAGADAGADYLKHYNVTVDYIVLGSAPDARTVNAGIDAAIVEGYDGIAVAPFSPGTEVYIDKAVDAGIPVVTLYGESPIPSKRTAFLGQDAYSAGREAGQYIAARSAEPGQYAIITGQFTVGNHEQRRGGCADYLDSLGWESVGVYEAMDKADHTYHYAKDIITSNPDIKAIYMTAGGPFGAATAAREMGRDDIVIIGHDEVPENLEYVAQGQMCAISQDTKGVAINGLIVLYNKLVAGKDPAQDFFPSQSAVITKGNVADFLGG